VDPVQLKRTVAGAFAALLLSPQVAGAGGRLPDGFLGWFAPAPQSCAAAVLIEVATDAITTAASVQRITRVEQSPRFPRWAKVGLQTVGGAGTEEVVIELAPDGQDLRVLFRDGSWLTWRRCL
jgi:hypothetical protein